MDLVVISAAAYITGGSRRARRVVPGAHRSFSSSEPDSTDGTGAHRALSWHGGLHRVGERGRDALGPGLSEPEHPQGGEIKVRSGEKVSSLCILLSVSRLCLPLGLKLPYGDTNEDPRAELGDSLSGAGRLGEAKGKIERNHAFSLPLRC